MAQARTPSLSRTPGPPGAARGRRWQCQYAMAWPGPGPGPGQPEMQQARATRNFNFKLTVPVAPPESKSRLAPGPASHGARPSPANRYRRRPILVLGAGRRPGRLLKL
jgi:hypothetical protein